MPHICSPVPSCLQQPLQLSIYPFMPYLCICSCNHVSPASSESHSEADSLLPLSLSPFLNRTVSGRLTAMRTPRLQLPVPRDKQHFPSGASGPCSILPLELLPVLEEAQQRLGLGSLMGGELQWVCADFFPSAAPSLPQLCFLCAV